MYCLSNHLFLRYATTASWLFTDLDNQCAYKLNVSLIRLFSLCNDQIIKIKSCISDLASQSPSVTISPLSICLHLSLHHNALAFLSIWCATIYFSCTGAFSCLTVSAIDVFKPSTLSTKCCVCSAVGWVTGGFSCELKRHLVVGGNTSRWPRSKR